MRAGRQEGGRRRRRRKSRGSERRSEWKKRARLNGVGGGVARARLLCERLKVSLIFPTITPPVFLLVARLLFAKLKGPTPSRSRHHPRGAVLLPLARGGTKRPSFHILPIKMQLTHAETSGTILCRCWRRIINLRFARGYRRVIEKNTVNYLKVKNV